MFCPKCGNRYDSYLKSCPFCKKREEKSGPAQVVTARDTFGQYREMPVLPVAKLKLADFPLRMAAFLIDGLVLMLPAALVSWLTGPWAGVIITIIVSWLYYSFFESSELQATIGKVAINLKVINVEGNRIDFLTATKRYWGLCLSLLILGAGVLMIMLNDKKQGLHDMLADCLVIDSLGVKEL